MPNRVRELREERKLPVSTFARLVGFSDHTVRQWEAQNQQPTQRNARRIARALGVPVDQVVTTEPPPDRRPLLVAAIIPHPEGRPEVLMTGRRFARERVWSWPSGHVEPEETPEEAVIRELGEELVIDNPRVVRLLGTVDTHLDVSRWWGQTYQQGYVQHCFEVAIGSPTVEVIDHEELVVAEWRGVDELAATFSHLPSEIRNAAMTCALQATNNPNERVRP